MATLMYVQDYDDTLFIPDYVVPGSTPTAVQLWFSYYEFTTPLRFTPQRGLLQPYMKSVAIQDCPSAVSLPGTGTLSQSQLAYGLNTFYLFPRSASAPFDYIPASLAATTTPAETVLLADVAGFTGSTGNVTLTRSSVLERPSNGRRPTFHGRHSGMGSVLWLDGHVKAFKPIFRTVGFGFTTPADFARLQVGDLARNQATLTDDFYFRLDK
jgi:prepilin-type processing-associated H-X9-DG protein